MTFLAVRPRGVVTGWSVGTTTATITLPEVADGDVIVVFIGGGNRVTAYPPGWDFEEYLTGQEAQGIVLSKFDGTSADSGTTISVDFDGGDPRFVAAIAVQNAQYWVVNESYRHGTAGATFAAGDLDWTADQYQGDLSATFVFARNASTAPTMGRGLLWNPDATTYSGSAGALFLESLPEYSAGEPFTIGLPERSGAVVYSLAFYRRNTTEYGYPAPFEIDLPGGAIADLAYRQAATQSRDSISLERGDFLRLQLAAQIEGPSVAFHTVASWGYNIVEGIPGDPATLYYDVTRGFQAYGRRLTEGELTPPLDVEEPPDVEDREWEDGSPTAGAQVINLVASGDVYDFDVDDTTGTEVGTSVPNHVTAWRRITDLVWSGSAPDPVAWTNPGEPAGLLLHTRYPEGPSPQVGDIAKPFTVDITGALTGATEWQFAIFNAGPGGVGNPTVDLWSYTSGDGGAAFGSRFEINLWAVTVQPGRRRFLVRRAPVVDLLAPLVSVLRRYPRDDAYGFGNVARNYPPPRRLRNYGQQP